MRINSFIYSQLQNYFAPPLYIPHIHKYTYMYASIFSTELSALVLLSMLTPNWSKPQLEVVWDLIWL